MLVSYGFLRLGFGCERDLLGHIGRVLIAGLLTGYGLIGQHILIIIAGLLFLPLLPMLLAMGFGITGGRWRLALYGLAAYVLLIALIVAGVFVLGFVLYYVMKLIKRSQGIDVTLAFKEIPIE